MTMLSNIFFSSKNGSVCARGLQRGTALLFLLFKLKNGLVGGHQDKYEMKFPFELVKATDCVRPMEPFFI